jgi:hypothetical protein
MEDAQRRSLTQRMRLVDPNAPVGSDCLNVRRPLLDASYVESCFGHVRGEDRAVSAGPNDGDPLAAPVSNGGLLSHL